MLYLVLLKYLYNVLSLLNREFILNTINLNIENSFYFTRVTVRTNYDSNKNN